MADPIFGSKYGPQNGAQNWITFSFLLLGLCLGPILGSIFGPKNGVSHRRISLLPAEVLQADLRRTSMSVSVNTCFFSLCVPLCFLYICIQGLFGAGKSKSMAVLLLALLELDDTQDLKMLFICKENSGTRSFADLLQWLAPPPASFQSYWKAGGRSGAE